jgi:hypothetical protein
MTGLNGTAANGVHVENEAAGGLGSPAIGLGAGHGADTPRGVEDKLAASPGPEQQAGAHAPLASTAQDIRKDPATDTARPAVAGAPQSQGVKTVEEMMAELLRPMLREWLDANLPAIVENVVKAEMGERFAGRRDGAASSGGDGDKDA